MPRDHLGCQQYFCPILGPLWAILTTLHISRIVWTGQKRTDTCHSNSNWGNGTRNGVSWPTSSPKYISMEPNRLQTSPKRAKTKQKYPITLPSSAGSSIKSWLVLELGIGIRIGHGEAGPLVGSDSWCAAPWYRSHGEFSRGGDKWIG